MKSKKYLIAIVIVLVAILIWWFINRSNQVSAPEIIENTKTNQNQEPQPETPPKENQATNQLPSKDSVIVSTQINDSSSVTIDNINLSKPGFIIISIDDSGAVANNFLGASGLLPIGQRQDIEISLKNARLDSSITYKAVIYYDDGDKKFDINKDTLVTGSKAATTFTAE